jgi:hypothetical protein
VLDCSAGCHDKATPGSRTTIGGARNGLPGIGVTNSYGVTINVNVEVISVTPPVVAATVEITEEEEKPNTIGNNPKDKKGRINTDLPGGQAAADDIFGGLAEGEVTTDTETGAVTADNGVLSRPGADGRPRVDVPADVGPSGKHETIHFND